MLFGIPKIPEGAPWHWYHAQDEFHLATITAAWSFQSSYLSQTWNWNAGKWIFSNLRGELVDNILFPGSHILPLCGSLWIYRLNWWNCRKLSESNWVYKRVWSRSSSSALKNEWVFIYNLQWRFLIRYLHLFFLFPFFSM